MIVDPDEPQAQPLPNPSVMGADEIVGHVDRAMSSLPPEAHGAISHAHGLIGGGSDAAQPIPSPGPGYVTKLPDQQEQGFQSWAKEKKVPWVDEPNADYDMRGYYQALQSGDPGARQSLNAADGKMHFPDTWKTPFHKTFSNESKYATPDAPHWDRNRLIDNTGRMIADESGTSGLSIPPMLAASPEISPNDATPIGMPSVPNSPMSQFGDPGFKPAELPSNRMIPERMKTLESPSMMAPTGAGETPLPNARAVSGRTSTLESPQMMGPQLSPYAPLPSPAATELKRLRDTGSGVSQIHNPFLKTAGTIADVIGSGFFPQFAQFVPGSSAHHQGLIANKESQVADEQGQQKAADESALHQAQVDETHGRAAQEAARAEALAHPPDPKDWTQVTEPIIDPAHPENGPQVAYVNKNDPTKIQFLGKAAAKPTEAKQPTNEMEAWMQAPENKGKPVADVLKHFWTAKADATGQEKSKPLTKETAATLNSAWNSLAPKYHMAENPFREGMSDSEVKHVQDSVNAIVGRNQGAQSIVINQEKATAAAANKQDKDTSSEYKTHRKELIKDFSDADKQLSAVRKAREEISANPVGQNVGTIATIVAAAGGQGSGVRVTQAELNSLTSHLGPYATFQNWLSSIQGKGKFDDATKAQIDQVLSGVEKIASDKEALLNDTLDRMGDAKSVKEIRDMDKEYRHKVSSGSSQDELPAEAVSKLKEGHETKFGNGQVWTMDGGKPKMVSRGK